MLGGASHSRPGCVHTEDSCIITVCVVHVCVSVPHLAAVYVKSVFMCTAAFRSGVWPWNAPPGTCILHTTTT